MIESRVNSKLSANVSKISRVYVNFRKAYNINFVNRDVSTKKRQFNIVVCRDTV